MLILFLQLELKMLENKLKKIILSLSFVAFVFTAFAATTDLSLRFLDKAELALPDINKVSEFLRNMQFYL